ncbi:MAG: hypothetical protein PHW22_04145 [Bacilli bacterium]|nr:hypothetical protein [Bacilli bacterium]
MVNKDKKAVNFATRIKNFDNQTWVVLALEFIFGVILIVFDVNFFINLAKGIPFLGEDYHSYEIGISIFLLILCLIMIVIFFYDLLFRNYEKEKENYIPKAVHDGKVIDISEKKSKDTKDNLQK